jgi:hypothetical protein
MTSIKNEIMNKCKINLVNFKNRGFWSNLYNYYAKLVVGVATKERSHCYLITYQWMLGDGSNATGIVTGGKMSTACKINLVEAVQLAMFYFGVTFDNPKWDKAKDRTISLILDGKLEEADKQADSLPEPVRNEIKCAILRLPLETSFVASDSYNMEAYAFAYWFMQQKLTASQSFIRAAILRDILEGTPILADRKAKLLEDRKLREDVSQGIDDLVTAWYQYR